MVSKIFYNFRFLKYNNKLIMLVCVYNIKTEFWYINLIKVKVKFTYDIKHFFTETLICMYYRNIYIIDLV